MQKTLHWFPHAVFVLELHLQRDPPVIRDLLHRVEQAGYLLRTINYEGEIVLTEMAMILDQPQEHWTLWLRK